MSNSILNSSIERFTRMMFSRVIERLAVVLSEEELSFSQVATLHIVDLEKSISIQDLSLRLNLSLSATSRLVDDLVKTDFIERSEDQKDRRSKNLKLTPHGQSFLDLISVERVKIIKKTAEMLPKAISEKLLNALSMNKGKKT